MAASTNDLFKKTGAGTVTTLSAPGKAIGATSINVGTTTNYPLDTGIIIAIRTVDTKGELVAGTYTEFSATVTSGTSLSIVATPVYGSDQIYSAGSTTQVFIPLSSYEHNKMIDGITAQHNQDGSHKNITSTNATITNATITNLTIGSQAFSDTMAGWSNANETWAYVSVDNPTGVFKVNADVTTKYSLGMRLRFVNGGNTIYGIITAVGAYTGGFTNITFLHEINPATSTALYLMANSAITSNYYSNVKVPTGFPLDPTKWTIVTLAVNNPTKTSPTANTWYGGTNAWTTGTAVTPIFPIGSWDTYACSSANISLGSAGYTSVFLTLSSNPAVGNDRMLSYGFTFSTTQASYFISFSDNVTVTSKTTYYLMMKTDQTATSILLQNSGTPIKILAKCAYL